MKQLKNKSDWMLFALGILLCAGVVYYFANRPNIELAQPHWLWLLLGIPVYLFVEIFGFSRRQPKLNLPVVSFLTLSTPWQVYARKFMPLLAAVALGALAVAIARPQSSNSWQDVSSEGIDIVVSMDISVSMLARDFTPNRLEASKKMAVNFIENRPNDRIGLVVYEGESFTQCPLTTDHRVLTTMFQNLKPGLIEGGTAVGMGLATAGNRLRDSEAISKVIILLTDGENNAGSISPLTAADIAQSYGIRVYTIGVGSRGTAVAPVAIYPDGSYKYDRVPVKIDEDMLREIASKTGGTYFRATDNSSLASIYGEIDQMERTRFNVTRHSTRSDEFFVPAAFGSLLLLLVLMSRYTLLRIAP